MFERQSALGALIHFTAWIAAYSVVTVVFTASESRSAYALLSGWWCALYAASIMEMQVTTAISTGIAFVAFDLVARAAGLSSLYHDSSGINSYAAIGSIERALVFVSPILLNSAIAAIRRRVAPGKAN